MEEGLTKVTRRVVKSFQDIAILAVLEENENLTGYQVMRRIYEKLGIHLPAGTIYAALYALEREQLIKAVSRPKCRTYTLTSKGEVRLRGVDEIARAFNHFMRRLCGKYLSTQHERFLSSQPNE
jgi:DNA-binding PadR family transcriptional regulator